MSLKSCLAILAVAVGLAGPAAASSVIIDTLNKGVTIGKELGMNPSRTLFDDGRTRQNPLGLSFTLTQDTKDIQIEALFTSFGNASAGYNGTFEIFSGAGVTGTALTTVAFAIANDDVLDRKVASRVGDFSAYGTLAAGTYTAAVRASASSADFALLGNAADIKTLGTESYGPAGVFTFATTDKEFGFRVTGETVAVSAVPLPAAGLLLLFAVGGLGLAARRRA